MVEESLTCLTARPPPPPSSRITKYLGIRMKSMDKIKPTKTYIYLANKSIITSTYLTVLLILLSIDIENIMFYTENIFLTD